MLDAQIDAAVKSGRKKIKRRKKDDGEVSVRLVYTSLFLAFPIH